MFVQYTPKAATFLMRQMPAKDAKALRAKLDRFAETGEGDVKRLVGHPGQYRLRHGDWRAIFEITGDVLVVRIAHRREVYD